MEYRIHPEGVSVARFREQVAAAERALGDLGCRPNHPRREAESVFLRGAHLLRAGCDTEAATLYTAVSHAMPPMQARLFRRIAARYVAGYPQRIRIANVFYALLLTATLRPGLALFQARLKAGHLRRRLARATGR